MIPEHEIDELLRRVEESNAMGSTSTYSRLLRFLVDCTLSENIPKEQAIAEHLLGKNDAKSDSSKIRVYVFHLRKKLQQYYENEGREEPYILSIPKGAYRVQLKARQPVSNPPVPKFNTKSLTYTLLGGFILSLFVNVFLLLVNRSQASNPFQHSVFWKEFFSDEKPIQIVVGDLFIFSERDSVHGEVYNVRLPVINTLDQFETYRQLEVNTGRDLKVMSYTHLSKGSLEWISSLTKIFHPERPFNIRSGSRIDTRDLHDYNIVFVGMQKTAGLFNSYFDQSVFNYDIAQTDQYQLSKDHKILTFEPQGDPDNKHADYGFIAKYPGPNDNTIFMFAGLWDSAASESLRNFTTTSKLAEMEAILKAKFGYIPPYFELLIEVHGVDRIGFETKVLYVHEVGR